MGCWEQSGFRGRQARNPNQPLQTRRAELDAPDPEPLRPLQTASTPRRIRFSRGSPQRLSGVLSASLQASFRSWEFRCDGTGAWFSLSAQLVQILRLRSRFEIVPSGSQHAVNSNLLVLAQVIFGMDHGQTGTPQVLVNAVTGHVSGYLTYPESIRILAVIPPWLTAASHYSALACFRMGMLGSASFQR